MGSRQSQASRVGRLGAQGASRAQTLLCQDWFAQRRRGKLDGAVAAASGKQRRKENGDDVRDLTSGRKAAVNGALDTPRGRGHVKAGGGAYGRA